MPEAKKRAIGDLWSPRHPRDRDAVASLLGEDARYEDVRAPAAHGPVHIVKHLRIGLDPVERLEHPFHRIVAEGDGVVLEHSDVWPFETGEVVRSSFVNVREIRKGKVTPCKDY